jgi:DNA-binding response OmpR family regulator
VALLQRKRVLIVDDEALVRNTLADILADAGYQTVIAPSWDMGETGFEALDYALVITDIFMPGRSGFDVIADVQAKWPNVKIMAISGGWGGTSSEDAITAAQRMGAHDVLSKPFEREDLLAKVHDLIGDP